MGRTHAVSGTHPACLTLQDQYPAPHLEAWTPLTVWLPAVVCQKGLFDWELASWRELDGEWLSGLSFQRAILRDCLSVLQAAVDSFPSGSK